jgi:hypothetical protein
LKRHLSRKHPEIHKQVELKDLGKKTPKSHRFKPVKRLESAVASSSRLDASKLQMKMTDFVAISPVMNCAINLAVHSGMSFSTFNCTDMRTLTTLAKKGALDNTKAVVNAENVKSAIRELAKLRREEVKKLLKRKVLGKLLLQAS